MNAGLRCAQKKSSDQHQRLSSSDTIPFITQRSSKVHLGKSQCRNKASTSGYDHQTARISRSPVKPAIWSAVSEGATPAHAGGMLGPTVQNRKSVVFGLSLSSQVDMKETDRRMASLSLSEAFPLRSANLDLPSLDLRLS